MALFKILRGPKSALEKKSIVDGYAYFVPENEGFYIDYAPEDVEVGRRIHINPKSFGIETILVNKGWDNEGLQTITIPELTADSIGTIGLSPAADGAQIQMASEANLYIKAQKDGEITIGFRGTKPGDLPVYIVVNK